MTRTGFFHTLRCISQGQTLLRTSMNQALVSYTLKGRVLDIGGGHSPDYFFYFQHAEGVTTEIIDGSEDPIDFETDSLPFGDKAFDTLILCNVLEHVYNHRFLLGETKRILANGGQLIGFVPFLIQYHPDPHDYFRYTHEALKRLLEEAGFTNVQIRRVGGGPFLVNFNMLVLSMPRFLSTLLYPLWAGLDAVFLKMRPGARVRYPLGFIFTGSV